MSKQKAMLIKFESKSNRVKGLAFHPKRPWILASLHNGCIQLWDYRMEVLIDKYEEHDGPVRGVHFHSSQPLFVSGGDDYKIKVWNYSARRCLFNLLGHLDYIRTVQFHSEYPWILSASDDQTIRIWNWQSRQCLSVLTGHNHYVMCAQFHPKEDLVLSASLDQTVRVWDVAGLRKKTVSIAGDFSPPGMQQSGQNGGQADLFGASDVVVKHVLEGHTRGVNWASFHRSLPLIVSGADDREVKLWRMNDSKAWEVDTMRGHLNNVSCVLFHPKRDAIVSNSEDKTIRVWDMSKVANPLVLRREHDRYWILDAHPSLNLLAAGHDAGLMVFKLNRERPPFDASGSSGRHVYFYKDGYVYEYSFKSGREKPILSTGRRRPNTGAGNNNNNNNNVTGSGSASPYRHLHYNHANQTAHCILLTSDQDGSYELYTFPKSREDAPSAAAAGHGRAGSRSAPTANMNMDSSSDGGVSADQQSAQRGYAKCAVFVSRNRFAVLDKQRQLFLKTLKNETKRKITLPGYSVNYIFSGGVGRLLLRTSENILLYDVQSLKVLAEMQTQSRHPVKYTCWSNDGAMLAMYSKATIYLTTSRLEELATVNENSRIKSGAWDAAGAFIYTTATHIKYLLPNGDNGILRTLEQPVYLTSASSSSPSAAAGAAASPAASAGVGSVTFLDRELRVGRVAIDSTEYLFKLALSKHKNREVLRLMQTKKLVGESIIAYLHRKGYPEVALHFVEDPLIKFQLALECGNIGVALECASKLDKDQSWHQLGVEALRQGNHQVVEAAYQRTKNFERLSFLYLLTGNIDKLGKMLHIATLRSDAQGRFHNALYLGNVPERIRVLKEAGQYNLAYAAAKAHGLEEEAESILAEIGGAEKLPTALTGADADALFDSARLLLPPTPILKEQNWPLLEVRKGFFEQAEAAEEAPQARGEEGTYESSGDEAEGEEDVISSWGESADIDIDVGADGKKKKKPAAKAAAAAGAGAPEAAADAAATGGGWGGDLDIELPEDAGAEAADAAAAAGEDTSDYFVMPLSGKNAATRWSSSSSLAADQIAAGAFDQAMHLLHRQIGAVNFQPLKEGFLSIHNAAQAYLSTLPLTPPLHTPMFRQQDGKEIDAPNLACKLSHVVEPLKSAYKNVTEGKFAAALKEFVGVLHTLPLVVVDKRAEVAEVAELLSICREYVTAIRLELARKESESDPVRATALAAYFTACKLQTTHLILGLKSAIKAAYTIKNYSMTANFCRRLLEICAQSNSAAVQQMVNVKQIKGVLAVCEKSNTDASPIDFPESNFTLCCQSLTPIAKGQPVSRCPYCTSTFKAEYDEQICPNCSISKIGRQATGLRVFPE